MQVNMNKRILSLISGILLIGLIFTSTPVLAQEQEEASIGEVSEPGILPDSPFYFGKSWGRAMRDLFTFDSGEKAMLKLRFANEDALAINELHNKGKYQLAEKHCEIFQEMRKMLYSKYGK